MAIFYWVTQLSVEKLVSQSKQCGSWNFWILINVSIFKTIKCINTLKYDHLVARIMPDASLVENYVTQGNYSFI